MEEGVELPQIPEEAVQTETEPTEAEQVIKEAMEAKGGAAAFVGFGGAQELFDGISKAANSGPGAASRALGYLEDERRATTGNDLAA